MAWREMPRVALALAALLAAATARAPTSDPQLFEAAFQGKCGEGSPCEQLCRELHDGTFECGCGPGYVLHVDGYECLELNSTKATESSSDKQEDVLYQKDVSFSAELEVAPSNRLSRFNVSERHIDNDKRRLTTLPTLIDTVKEPREPNYTLTGERSKEVDGLKSLIEDGVSRTDLNIIADEKEKDALAEANKIKVTTLGPSLEQKVPGGTLSPARTTAVESCQCGACGEASCVCAADKCKTNMKIVTPRFSGASWLALRALRGAYKRVRLRLRVRPERARGVLLLTGEHDDLSGDYLALILRNGHVELRYDCGSGAGVLRSPEPVRLGRWNSVSVYRHRWDAWLKLNNGKRVRGRSKGLFSRMTFREPVWVGGAGNTTGLQSKLGLAEGLLGCVDFLRINGETYRLVKDAVSTSDIAECAPTLAPWRPSNEVTSETVPHKLKPVEIHGLYDINDIVHFEDNDIVMRDAKDHNKLDNSLLQYKYDVRAQFNDEFDKHLNGADKNDIQLRFNNEYDKKFSFDIKNDDNKVKANNGSKLNTKIDKYSIDNSKDHLSAKLMNYQSVNTNNVKPQHENQFFGVIKSDSNDLKAKFYDKFDKQLLTDNSKSEDHNDLVARINDEYEKFIGSRKIVDKNDIKPQHNNQIIDNTKSDDRNDLITRFNDEYDKFIGSKKNLNKNEIKLQRDKQIIGNMKSDDRNDLIAGFNAEYDKFIGSRKSFDKTDIKLQHDKHIIDNMKSDDHNDLIARFNDEYDKFIGSRKSLDKNDIKQQHDKQIIGNMKSDDPNDLIARFNEEYDKFIGSRKSLDKNDIKLQHDKQIIGNLKNDDHNDLIARFNDEYDKFIGSRKSLDKSYIKPQQQHEKQLIGDTKSGDRNDLVTKFNDEYDKFIGIRKSVNKNYVASQHEKQFIGTSRSDNNYLKSAIVNNVGNDLRSNENKKDCECQHGGGCFNRVCLCPLGYAGERCEITLDLKVPRFNGSSYLRLPGLGNSAQSWLDIQITLKPANGDGLLLYDAEHPSGDGDFFSLHLRDYFVEFAFDLGSGIALVRSAYPLEQNKWHRISVSRSARRASLRVRRHDSDVTDTARSVTSRGVARHLTLRQPMMLGGAPHPLPPRLALKTSFSGCVSKLVINDEELSVVSAALGGVNVDNCDEARNDTCTDPLCKETLDHIPPYPQNISINDIHHSIVAKKGFKTKYLKVKSKKHAQHLHIEKYKKKKYLVNKKRLHVQNDIEKKNDIMTEGPIYDGQTYMQVKYLDTNEINWGDTNTYPSFSGKDSFIHIDDEETIKRLLSYTLDINIRFRAVSPAGLLVWSGRVSPPGDFLSLAVEDSVLVFRYDLGSGEVIIIANHTKVDDGLWHRARATRNRQAGVLEVDGLGSVGKISPGKLKQLNTENGLYIGGLPSIELNTMGKYKSGLIGCVSQISLSGDFDIPLSLSKLPHTITNNVGRCTP